MCLRKVQNKEELFMHTLLLRRSQIALALGLKEGGNQNEALEPASAPAASSKVHLAQGRKKGALVWSETAFHEDE